LLKHTLHFLTGQPVQPLFTKTQEFKNPVHTRAIYHGQFPNYPPLVTEHPANPPRAPGQIIIRISRKSCRH